MSHLLTSHINFVKAHDSTNSTSKNEIQAFKAKRSHVSNNKGRSQPPLTQRDKAQTRAPQPKHVYYDFVFCIYKHV